MKDIVLDHGSVELLRSVGDDLAVVNAARVSFGRESSAIGDPERGLIRYLMRERHGTPFEVVDLTFRVSCPLAVAREWMRHRISSFNEVSGRYVKLEPLFYVPAEFRRRVGKPGRYQYEPVDPSSSSAAQKMLRGFYDYADRVYEELWSLGVAPEQARLVNPLGIYTEFIYKANLRSFLNFTELRAAPNAMEEIRCYAVSMERMAREVAPECLAAFDAAGRRAP